MHAQGRHSDVLGDAKSGVSNHARNFAQVGQDGVRFFPFDPGQQTRGFLVAHLLLGQAQERQALPDRQVNLRPQDAAQEKRVPIRIVAAHKTDARVAALGHLAHGEHRVERVRAGHQIHPQIRVRVAKLHDRELAPVEASQILRKAALRRRNQNAPDIPRMHDLLDAGQG